MFSNTPIRPKLVGVCGTSQVLLDFFLWGCHLPLEEEHKAYRQVCSPCSLGNLLSPPRQRCKAQGRSQKRLGLPARSFFRFGFATTNCFCDFCDQKVRFRAPPRVQAFERDSGHRNCKSFLPRVWGGLRRVLSPEQHFITCFWLSRFPRGPSKFSVPKQILTSEVFDVRSAKRSFDVVGTDFRRQECLLKGTSANLKSEVRHRKAYLT